MTTRSELDEVQSPHIDQLDTGQVAECLDDSIVLVIHNKGTTALMVPAVPHLSCPSTEFAGVGDLDNIGVRMKGLEEGHGLLGLGERLCSGSNDQGDLLDLLDAVTTGGDEQTKGRSGKGRDNSETALVLVHLDVPLAPSLGGCKDATSMAHVTDSSLDSMRCSSLDDR